MLSGQDLDFRFIHISNRGNRDPIEADRTVEGTKLNDKMRMLQDSVRSNLDAKGKTLI